MSLNQLKLNGFIGNYELSYTPNGKAIGKGYIKFTVGKGQGDNEWLHEIMSIVVWGDLAEEVNTFDFDKIYVLEGKLNIRRYAPEGKDERKYYELVVFQASLDVKPDAQAHPNTAPAKGTQVRKPYGYKGAGGRATGSGSVYTPKAKLADLDDHPF